MAAAARNGTRRSLVDAAAETLRLRVADGDFGPSDRLSPALRSLADGLVEGSRRGAPAVYSLPEAARRSIAQHVGVVDALVAGDTARAAELAGAHMVDAARRYAVGVTE